MDKFIHFDECQDVLVSLEQCVTSLAQIRRTRCAWKWVVISLHSALQGAMVCHLSGTAQLGALAGKSSKEMLDWHERDRRGELDVPEMRAKYKKGNPPIEKIADAVTLFKRLDCSEEE